MSNKTTLRQQVYVQLKRAITICTLAPGAALSENLLVTHFQISKTPIREALTSLVQDRLVEYFPNRGFSVTNVSVVDIQEIFDARIFFETELFRLALGNMSAAEIERLEMQTRPEADPTSCGVAEALLESDLAFHMHLAKAAHNSRLLFCYEILMNEAQRLSYMDLKLRPHELPRPNEHGSIIQALRNRDLSSGAMAIRTALENARKRILEG